MKIFTKWRQRKSQIIKHTVEVEQLELDRNQQLHGVSLSDASTPTQNLPNSRNNTPNSFQESRLHPLQHGKPLIGSHDDDISLAMYHHYLQNAFLSIGTLGEGLLSKREAGYVHDGEGFDFHPVQGHNRDSITPSSVKVEYHVNNTTCTSYGGSKVDEEEDHVLKSHKHERDRKRTQTAERSLNYHKEQLNNGSSVNNHEAHHEPERNAAKGTSIGATGNSGSESTSKPMPRTDTSKLGSVSESSIICSLHHEPSNGIHARHRIDGGHAFCPEDHDKSNRGAGTTEGSCLSTEKWDLRGPSMNFDVKRRTVSARSHQEMKHGSSRFCREKMNARSLWTRSASTGDQGLVEAAARMDCQRPLEYTSSSSARYGDGWIAKCHSSCANAATIYQPTLPDYAQKRAERPFYEALMGSSDSSADSCSSFSALSSSSFGGSSTRSMEVKEHFDIDQNIIDSKCHKLNSANMAPNRGEHSDGHEEYQNKEEVNVDYEMATLNCLKVISTSHYLDLKHLIITVMPAYLSKLLLKRLKNPGLRQQRTDPVNSVYQSKFHKFLRMFRAKHKLCGSSSNILKMELEPPGMVSSRGADDEDGDEDEHLDEEEEEEEVEQQREIEAEGCPTRELYGLPADQEVHSENWINTDDEYVVLELEGTKC